MFTSTSEKSCLDVYNLISQKDITSNKSLTDDDFLYIRTCVTHVKNHSSHYHVPAEKFEILHRKVNNGSHGSIPSIENVHPKNIRKEPPPALSKDNLMENLELQLIQDIDREVKHFLFPYISGRITPEEEEKRMTSFLTTITKKLSEKHTIVDIDRFNFLVLYCYFEVSARGLFTNGNLKYEPREPGLKRKPRPPETIEIYKMNSSLDEQIKLESDSDFKNFLMDYHAHLSTLEPKAIIPAFSQPVLVLLNALLPALKKDFSAMNLTPDFIVQETIMILLDLDKSRKEDYRLFSEERKATLSKSEELPEGALSQDEIFYTIQQKQFIYDYFVEMIGALKKEKQVLYLSDLTPEQQKIEMNNDEYMMLLEEYQTWVNDVEIAQRKPTKQIIAIISDALFELGREFSDYNIDRDDILKELHAAFKKLKQNH